LRVCQFHQAAINFGCDSNQDSTRCRRFVKNYLGIGFRHWELPSALGSPVESPIDPLDPLDAEGTGAAGGTAIGGNGIGSWNDDSRIPEACTTPLPTRSILAPACDTPLLIELADFSIAIRALSVAIRRSFCAAATASVNGLFE
jgi:hypothetical protein